MTDPHTIARGLTQIERAWFTQKTWGSWVYAVGMDLIDKGLTKRVGVDIQLTETGEAVRRVLEEEAGNP